MAKDWKDELNPMAPELPVQGWEERISEAIYTLLVTKIITKRQADRMFEKKIRRDPRWFPQ